MREIVDRVLREAGATDQMDPASREKFGDYLEAICE